jgi:serine/threonine-protein kinase
MMSGPADPKSSQAQPSWVVGPPVPPASRLGQLFDGEFLIKGILGQGELGVTYEADNTRLKRRFAVLMLSRGLKPTHAMMLAVRDDMRRAQQLTAAGLMPVKLIADRDGIPGFATELLEGETLRGRLGRGPLRVERALALALSMAHTLAAAHKAGLVHGDLRPENIFLVRPGAKSTFAGKAMLVEHALYHLRRRTPGLDDRLPLYKLMYRPPEQVLGEAGASEQGDVWALGAILYESLTGKPAFYAEEPEFVLDNLGSPPPPLQPALALGLHEELCAALDLLIASASARDLESRIPNMTEMLEGLEQLVRGAALRLPEVVVESREEAAAAPPPASPPNRRMNRLLQRLSGVFPQIQLPGPASQPPTPEPQASLPPAGRASDGSSAPAESVPSLPKIQLQPIVPPKERVSRILQKLSGAYPTISGMPPDEDAPNPAPPPEAALEPRALGQTEAAAPSTGRDAAKVTARAESPLAKPIVETPAPLYDVPTPKMSDLDRALEILKKQRVQSVVKNSPAPSEKPAPASPAADPALAVTPPFSQRTTMPPVGRVPEDPLVTAPPAAAPSQAPAALPISEAPTQPALDPAAALLPLLASAPASAPKEALEKATSEKSEAAAHTEAADRPTAPSVVALEPAAKTPVGAVEAKEPSKKSPVPAVKMPESSDKSPTPVAKPKEPSEKSPASAVKPKEPSAKSPVPVAKPKEPSAETPAPAVKPKEPSAKSPAPVAKSGELAAGTPAPAAPANQSAEPAAPVAKPAEPAAETPAPAALTKQPAEPPAPVAKPAEPSAKSPSSVSAKTPPLPGLSQESSAPPARDAAVKSATTPKPASPGPGAPQRPSDSLLSTLALEDLAEVIEASSPSMPVPELPGPAALPPVLPPTLQSLPSAPPSVSPPPASLPAAAPAGQEAAGEDDKQKPLPMLKTPLSEIPTNPAMEGLVEKLGLLTPAVRPALTEQATQPALRRMPITEMATQAKIDAISSDVMSALKAEAPANTAAQEVKTAVAASPLSGPDAPTQSGGTPAALPHPPSSPPTPPATPPDAVKPRPPRPPRVSQLIAALQAQQGPPRALPPEASSATESPRRVSPGLISPAPDILPGSSSGSVTSGAQDALASQSGRALSPSFIMRHQEAVAAIIGALLVVIGALLYMLLRP